ncbi:MAG TPA: RodZ domain-containing protein [Steroidobacter sp.]|uniref:RodZ domain-containing protein n=1 Tax=Steroidobacter sp. TaxID=1978227 RepID=UPI002EDB56B4
MNAAGDSSERPAAETAPADSPEPAAESLTPGELLRRERERRSIPQLHIAEELHLDIRMVEAIEANRFAELGVPVYARGHLRQYAALLGLSPQLIIERYEALTGRQEVPVPIPASVAVGSSVAMQRPSLAGPLWLGVALIAAAVGWWVWATVATPGDPVQAALDEQIAAEESDASSETVQTPSQPEVVPASPAPSAVQPAPATSSTTTPAAGAVRVRLEFSDASWTEIYDAAGKQLMFGLGESGRVRTISGTPPLRVTLGKASAVTVQVNDQPVVVPRRAGKDAAKFVIAASGAVEMMSQQTTTGEVSGE